MILIIGPSAVGKNAILSKLLAWDNTLEEVVSHTTREPRQVGSKAKGAILEKHGVHYYFTDKEEFSRLDNNGEFMETNEYVGEFYGTAIRIVKQIESNGKNPIHIVDINGADAIIKHYKELDLPVLSIFIQPPNDTELAKRLKKRGDKADKIEERLAVAQEEMAHMFKYDFRVINDKLSVAATKTLNMVHDFTGY